MGTLISFLTQKTVLGVAVIMILTAGLVGGVYVTQRQTQLKSGASEIMGPAPTEPFPCNRPAQPQIGDLVGRCGTANASGCYKTAYAQYSQQFTEERGDIDGDGLGDASNPQDQPWCVSNCIEPHNQCPAAPPAGGQGGTPVPTATAPTGQITNFDPPGDAVWNDGKWNPIKIYFSKNSAVINPRIMWMDRVCDKDSCPAGGWNEATECNAGSPCEWKNPNIQPDRTITIGLINGDGKILDAKQKAFPAITAVTPTATAVPTQPPAGGTACTFIVEGLVTEKPTTVVGGVTACLNPPAGGGCSSVSPSQKSTTNSTGIFTIKDIPAAAAGHKVYLQVPTGYKLASGVENPIIVNQNSLCQNRAVDFKLEKLSSGGPDPTEEPEPSSVDPDPTEKIQFRKAVGGNQNEAQRNLANAGYEDYNPETIFNNFDEVDISDLLADMSAEDNTRVIAVQFKKGDVEKTPAVKSIRYVGEGPVISNVDCRQQVSGPGTVINITGSNFGAAKGTVKVKGTAVTVENANWKNNQITVNLAELISGENEVEVTTSDNRPDTSTCSLGVTTAQVVVKNACNIPMANLDTEVEIFANVPAENTPDPLVSQRVRVDRDGKLTNFAPKLEKGTTESPKKYSVVVKAPKMIARKIDFEVTSGTKKIEVTLPIGDIAPAGGNGVIRSDDYSELIRQWNLVSNVTRTADLNGDSRVNSFDYTCLIKEGNFNEEDEEFSPPEEVTPTPTATVTTTPTPTKEDEGSQDD